MSHKNRGFAVIFNQENFEEWKSRPGTDIDCERLCQILLNLQFNVIDYKDLKRNKIHAVIKEISSKDHTQNDCILIAILSHGERDAVYAADWEYSIESLASYFTADKCPSLAGKPKLFFIQTCRGDRQDRGAVYFTQGLRATPQSGANQPDRLPVQADFLFAYATVPGYVSYRNTGQGSWYIQTLCDQLRINGTRYDLMKLLTIVNHKVATEFPKDASTTIKQMPYFNSSLTKFLTFTERNAAVSRSSERLNVNPPQ